jgi:predicted nucleic-acid-binding Zn-ribbon protein
MSSKKCLSCGLVNFASDEICKKCGSDLMNQKLSTACPKCASDNTQSFEMAYQTGTSSAAMIGISQPGGIAAGAGKSSSALAKNVKPPEKESVGESIGIIVAMIIVFNFLGVALMVLVDPFVGIFAAIILTIGGGIFGVIKSGKGKAEKDRVFQVAMKRWRQSWICLKCGGTWMVHQ